MKMELQKIKEFLFKILSAYSKFGPLVGTDIASSTSQDEGWGYGETEDSTVCENWFSPGNLI